MRSAVRAGFVAVLVGVLARDPPSADATSSAPGAPLEARARGPRRALGHPHGFVVGVWTEEATRRGLRPVPDFAAIAALGATHVAIPVPLDVDSVTASLVAVDPKALPATELIDWIARAHTYGLRVEVVPMIEVRSGARSDWRGRLCPRDPDRFFRSYGETLARLATLAERAGAEALCVAHELGSLTVASRRRSFREVTLGVRARFSGELTVHVNHDRLDSDFPWILVDRVGLSAYVAAERGTGPVGPRMLAALHTHGASWNRFATRVDRPVYISEIGYASSRGATDAPWDTALRGAVDLTEQADAFTAAADWYASTAGHVRGVMVWVWFGDGGPSDRHFTPRGKPALVPVRRLFAPRR